MAKASMIDVLCHDLDDAIERNDKKKLNSLFENNAKLDLVRAASNLSSWETDKIEEILNRKDYPEMEIILNGKLLDLNARDDWTIEELNNILYEIGEKYGEGCRIKFLSDIFLTVSVVPTIAVKESRKGVKKQKKQKQKK